MPGISCPFCIYIIYLLPDYLYKIMERIMKVIQYT